jgi:hypothetical protein
VIWDILNPIYVPKPKKQDWIKISNGYLERWNLPNCIGSIDGKHVDIQAPNKSGTLYFNYMKTFSLVLMAVCDYNYCFTMVDVGAYGSQSDGGVLENSQFGKAMLECSLDIPGDKNLPGTETPFPHYFIGDEAFPLKSYLLRPYPGRYLPDEKKVFNYRLSRARRTIENAFGILVARWRIFRSTIIANDSTVEKLILAAICLHNFIKTDEDSLSPQARKYCPTNFVDYEDSSGNLRLGQWREKAQQNFFFRIGRTGANAYRQVVKELRDTLATYLCSPEGEMQHQYAYINRGRH